MTTPPTIELRDVTHRYGPVTALRDVSIEIEQGSFTAIFGKNGAGKSTLISILGGAMAPSRGDVLVRGASPKESQTFITHSIAMVPEGRRLFAQMSTEDNILLGAFPLRLRREAVEARLPRVLDMFPARLRDRLKTPAGALSGGEQQMVAIARALIAEPDVILLDEPSLGLAPVIVKSVYRLLGDLHERGTTVVVVEQGAIALNYATRSLVLDQGSVVHEGEGADDEARRSIESAYFDVGA